MVKIKATALFLVIGYFLYVLFTSNIGNDKITIYQLFCDDFKSPSYACPDKLYATKLKLRVDKTNQTVINNIGIFGATSLGDCIIYDKKNWDCKDEVGSEVHLTNGKYYDEGNTVINPDGSESQRKQQISRIVHDFYIIKELFYD